MSSLEIEWDENDVMRAFPQLSHDEAQAVLRHISAYWADKEIPLLRRLCAEAGLQEEESDGFEMGPDGSPRMTDRLG